MAHYTVILTQDVTRSAVVDITALSEDEAEEKAMGLDRLKLNFEYDDGNVSDRPYVTSIEKQEE